MSFDKRAHLCNLCSYEDKTVLELPGGLDVKGSGVTAVTQVTAVVWPKKKKKKVPTPESSFMPLPVSDCPQVTAVLTFVIICWLCLSPNII